MYATFLIHEGHEGHEEGYRAAYSNLRDLSTLRGFGILDRRSREQRVYGLKVYNGVATLNRS